MGQGHAPPESGAGDPRPKASHAGSFKIGEQFAVLGALEQVADDEDWYRCLYVHPQNPQDVLYRVEFTVVPPGVGRPSSGNCGGTPTPGYLGTVKETEIESVKRYLSVDGGATRVSSDIAGGTLALWQSVLAQAEAQEIGQACP